MENMRVTLKQQQQVQILTGVVGGSLTVEEAAESLGKSLRQTRRLLSAFRERGVGGVVHGNTGRPAINGIPISVREQVIELAQGKYLGFNHTHLTEMLAEREGIILSRSTVRSLCNDAQLPSVRQHRRPKVHRKRRECRARAGEMIQLDGSPHDWLEGRGPRLTLVSGIDDATNQLWGLFREGETSESYMALTRAIVEEHGIPLSIYTDHTVIVAGTSRRYKPTATDPSAGVRSHFARACDDLGIAIILAHSPQAKGRIERSHDTLQDRLVSLLRLEGVTTMEGAQRVLAAYLPDHNRRFSHPASASTTAWRPWTLPLAIDDVFCPREERVVANDNTVRVFGHVIDIPRGPHGESYAKCHVWVHRRYDGTMNVFYQGQQIATASC
jgi:transposase